MASHDNIGNDDIRGETNKYHSPGRLPTRNSGNSAPTALIPRIPRTYTIFLTLFLLFYTEWVLTDFARRLNLVGIYLWPVAT